jgi:hypothetical protein
VQRIALRSQGALNVIIFMIDSGPIARLLLCCGCIKEVSRSGESIENESDDEGAGLLGTDQDYKTFMVRRSNPQVNAMNSLD